MSLIPERIQYLIDNPSESLSVELKRWIDPSTPSGKKKIVRAVLALRNLGGGFLVIGFDNDSLEPDSGNAPEDAQAVFHVDTIQGLISHYSSDPFEVTIWFPERGSQKYPVIEVPRDVKTPVAVKRDLIDGEDKILSEGDVYIRSLRMNNTPSAGKARWKDWNQIAETCFDNREADIGRFIRRHIGNIDPDLLRKFLSDDTGLQPGLSPEERLHEYTAVCRDKFNRVVQKRGVDIPDHGVWETALIIEGDVPSHFLNEEFLRLLHASNPRLTGWPVWLDSSGFRDEDAWPYVHDDAWEAIIVNLRTGRGKHIDFMRMEPSGRFYLRRDLEDDLTGPPSGPEPLTVLDFVLPIFRCAEAIAVGLAFAKAMGCDAESTSLAFSFRWTKLEGRELTSWVEPSRDLHQRRITHQDEVESILNVPLESPVSTLNEFTHQAVRPLFSVFSGFAVNPMIVEELTSKLLKGR